MSHRTIERVIGRLLTDEDWRREFSYAPRQTLVALAEQGWELSRLEVDALIRTDVRVWSDAAARIDSQLQRCSLKTRNHEEKRT
jgi:hypothetical protein